MAKKRLEPVIGQGKGKVGQEVSETEGREGGRKMEQNHVAWRSDKEQGIYTIRLYLSKYGLHFSHLNFYPYPSRNSHAEGR